MNDIELLKEKVLRLEQRLSAIGRSRQGLTVEPALNILGQNTRIDGLLTVDGYQLYKPVPLPTPLTSTSYDGNDTVAVGRVTIDTSAVFGAPVGIKMAAIYMQAKWSTANTGYAMAATYVGATPAAVLVRSQVNNFPVSSSGIVVCNANGDFDINVAGADATNVVLRIISYWI